MGEISYNLTLLFPDENKAESLCDSFLEMQESCDYELTCLLKKACQPSDPLSDHDYYLEEMGIRRFRNEVQIGCYAGRSSEIPVDFVPVFYSSGAHALHIFTTYDDGVENNYFVDGKNTNKKKFDQYYRKHKLEDDTDKLQRFLSNCTFSKALQIIDQCDLSRIKPENEFLGDLLFDKRYEKIVLSLLHAGLYDRGNVTQLQEGEIVYPWLLWVVEYGSREVLEAFLDYGFDPYDCGDGDVTAFHNCLSSGEISSVENCRLLIERYSENLNPVTGAGSPLWFGYEQQTNLVNCHTMKRTDARVIPPKGYYDELDGRDLVVKSVQHHDFETFVQNYSDDLYHDSLYWSLRYQSYEIVHWLNHKKEIDWESSFSGLVDEQGSFEQFTLDQPAYEIPFIFSKGLSCDENLLNYIVNSVPSNQEIYTSLATYVSGLDGLPNSVALLKQLLEKGADFGSESIINREEKSYPLYQALFNEALDNFEYLLQAGAKIPKSPYIDIEPMDEYIKDHFEGEKKKTALDILKKY